jgi:CubicO group peptidase (beta-lactamase class C family)
MKRRNFIKKSGQALLAVSSISITGAIVSSCQTDDNNDPFDDGYYGDGYYDDGYYDDGYYDDGYYDDGYYDDGYYDDGYYDDGYYGDAGIIRDTLLDGTWFVASYIDSGVDDTSDYNGYEVDFNANDEVVATNGTNTNNGSWVVDDNGFSVTLNFNGSPFDEFNSDWDIISVLPNRVELRDISGGGSGTDILVLEKI